MPIVLALFLLAGTAWAQTVPDANPFSPADLARGRQKDLHYDRGRSPMPSYRGTLSDAELDNVVAYLVGLRGTR
jgi:mono/diheme cytochrome c family protein